MFGAEFKYIQIPISTELWKADSLSACEHQVLVLRFDTGLVTHFNCQRASLLFTLKLSFYFKKVCKGEVVCKRRGRNVGENKTTCTSQRKPSVAGSATDVVKTWATDKNALFADGTEMWK